MDYAKYDFESVEGNTTNIPTTDRTCIIHHIFNGKILRDWKERLQKLGKKFLIAKGTLIEERLTDGDKKKSRFPYKQIYCLFSDNFYPENFAMA